MSPRILRFLVLELALVAALPCSTLSASTVTQTDRWSTAGGAWDDTYQSQWTTNNTLRPDADADFGATLRASVRPAPSGLAPTGGLYDTFYYTFFTTPAFSLSAGNVLDGLETITFEFSYGAGLTSVESIGLALNYNAANNNLAPSSFSTGSSQTIATVFGNQTFTRYSFTWIVGGFGETDAFTLNWALGSHNAFNGVALVQTAASSAVPEPASFAVLAGLGALALGASRRRRAR